ncbi:GntR family transcriptional regulator [Poriferisphaera sp. WC338]|uniref:GntR family transcriptional regulator n=1 Tax=Poriferisphaera sp. WC338 TaxID=3425129 RepID=UPI003D8196F5
MRAKSPANLMTLESAPEYAREAIREMIISGELSSGQRIDQRELAKKLELTTVPVREALCWLEAEGMVKRIPGRGVFCRAYTVDDIEEILEVRTAMESLAAGRAAERMSMKEKKELMKLAHDLTDVTSNEEFLKKHVAFHRKIVEFADSETMMSIWNFTHLTSQVLVNLAAQIWPVYPHAHIDLAEAIVSGDKERAAKAMGDHILPSYLDRLQELRDKYGDEPILQEQPM